jgi:malate synthase
MGGMAAQIPIKNDPAANEAALEKVRAGQAARGDRRHDGTWVAHPGLVPVAKEVFDEHMPGRTSTRQRPDVNVTAKRPARLPARGADHRGGLLGALTGNQAMQQVKAG